MHKIKKILVPIDFSDESGRALRDALSLAQETKAQLVALHMIDESTRRDFLLSRIVPVEGLPFSLDESRTLPLNILLRERTLDLRNFVDQQVRPTGQDKIVKVVRMGKVAEEMAAVIGEGKIDLLVLTLRKRFLFPDIATLKLLKIARRLSCPVLLDPSKNRNGDESEEASLHGNGAKERWLRKALSSPEAS